MSGHTRPTSPHLTIYKWQNSMALSILHRFTGIGLYAGLLLMVLWVWTVAYNPTKYADLHEYMSSDIGKTFLFGWTVAFYYHFGNGIRHMFWDVGRGFSLPAMARSGWTVLLFTILMTGFTWGFVFTNGN